MIWIILALVVASGFFTVPTNHNAFLTVFNKKLAKVYSEGLHYDLRLIIGFLGLTKVWRFNNNPKPLVLEGENAAKATSKDGIDLLVEVTVPYAPDKNALHVYSKMSQAIIQKALRDKIEEVIGEVAGEEEGDYFRTKREEVRLLINAELRLSRRVDFYLDKNNPSAFKQQFPNSFLDYLERLREANQGNAEAFRKIAKISNPAEWEVPLKEDTTNVLDVLNFYKQNVTRIETMLNLENTLMDKSATEESYGVDTMPAPVAKIIFSPEYTKAMEAKELAEKELTASIERHRKKMEILNDLKGAGVSADEANDSADAAVGIAPKQTVKGSIPFTNVTK